MDTFVGLAVDMHHILRDDRDAYIDEFDNSTIDYMARGDERRTNCPVQFIGRISPDHIENSSHYSFVMFSFFHIDTLACLSFDMVHNRPHGTPE